MRDTSHLKALELRLSNERVRLSNARTEDEKKMRQVWVAGIEKEIEQEKQFLSVKDNQAGATVSDEDLLKQLLD